MRAGDEAREAQRKDVVRRELLHHLPGSRQGGEGYRRRAGGLRAGRADGAAGVHWQHQRPGSRVAEAELSHVQGITPSSSPPPARTLAFCIMRSCGSTDTASRYTQKAHSTCRRGGGPACAAWDVTTAPPRHTQTASTSQMNKPLQLLPRHGHPTPAATPMAHPEHDEVAGGGVRHDGHEQAGHRH